MEQKNELLTPQQVASRLQVSVGMVLRLLRNSRLRGVKLGRHWRVRPADLEAYIEGSTARLRNTSIEETSAPVDPVAASKQQGFSAKSNLVAVGVIALLLVQVVLLLTMVIMASTWRSTVEMDFGSKALNARAASLDTNTIGIESKTASPSPNSIGMVASTVTDSSGKNPPPPPGPAPSPLPASPSPTTRATDTSRSQPSPLVVGNTGDEGVNIRLMPGNGDRVKAWPDGTIMVVIGEDKAADGRIWKNVRDPEGQKGWVAADYLVYPPVPTAPPVVAARSTSGFELELLTSNSYYQYNLSVVEGQVRNISGKNLSNVEALVQWYSTSNEIIKSETSLITYNPILQNQVSPFKIVTSFNPAMARYTIGFKIQGGGEIPALNSTKRLEQKDR